MVMNTSRRLLSECQFYTLIAFVALCAEGISTDIHPNDPTRKWLAGLSVLPLLFNGYFMLRHSSDIQAYERGVFTGLKRRLEIKTTFLVEHVSKPPPQ
jgi:hypothetical protein